MAIRLGISLLDHAASCDLRFTAHSALCVGFDLLSFRRSLNWATMRTKRIFLTAIVGIGLAGASPASAQSYPDRLIKIVVPYPPGGPADVAARLVTQPLSARLGQNVIVENQSGGGGRTGAKFVAHASADGYTLLLGGTNPNAIASLYRTLDFEPIKDFTAVGLIAFDSNALGDPSGPGENAP